MPRADLKVGPYSGGLFKRSIWLQARARVRHGGWYHRGDRRVAPERIVEAIHLRPGERRDRPARRIIRGRQAEARPECVLLEAGEEDVRPIPARTEDLRGAREPLGIEKIPPQGQAIRVIANAPAVLHRDDNRIRRQVTPDELTDARVRNPFPPVGQDLLMPQNSDAD